MKNRLLVTTAVCGFAFFAATPAYAACSNNTPSSGDPAITCTPGYDGTGVQGSGADNISVSIEDGAEVNGVILGSSATVGVSGTVYSGDGIQIDDGTITITGGSVINDGAAAIIVSNAGGSSLVDLQSGSIEGAGTSVRFTDGGAMNIGFSGNVLGAINFLGTGVNRVTNAGTIGSVNFSDNANAIYEFRSGSTVNGTVTAGAGANDTFVIGGAGLTNFDISQVSDALDATYYGFENFEKTGVGVTNLSGATTLTGTTTISGGVLSVGASNQLAAGGIVFNGGTLHYTSAFNQARNIALTGNGTLQSDVSATLSGSLSGSGNFTKAGSGVLILSGNNINTGRIIINGGTISVGANNNLGDSSGNNVIEFNGGRLLYTNSFDQTRAIGINTTGTIDVGSSNSTISGPIAGNGTLIKDGSGTLTLTGPNTYFGGTRILNGYLDISTNAQLGNAIGGVYIENGALRALATLTSARNIEFGADGGYLEVNTLGRNMTLSGTISGTGALNKLGDGIVTLSGTNTNSGQVIIRDGIIQASTGANLGSGAATNDLVLDGGTLRYTAAFDHARDVIVSSSGTLDSNFDSIITGVLSGSGKLFKAGSGSITLAGAHTHTGDLEIQQGTITLSESADRIYNGAITGLSNTKLHKDGTGALTIAQDQTYAGEVIVQGGLLTVNGDMSDALGFTAVSNGTLGGSGTVSSVEVKSGGRLAPGNSIGILNVDGTVVFENNSRYHVEYNSTGADKTIATGAVEIQPGAILDLTGSGAAGTFAQDQRFTILEGSSIVGLFETVNNNLAFLDAVQYSTGTKLDIALKRNEVGFADVTGDQHQRDVANAMEKDMPNTPVSNAFTGLTGEQARDALNQLGGEHNAGISGAAASMTTLAIGAVATHAAALSHISSSTGNLTPLLAPAQSNTSVYTGAYLEPAAGGPLTREAAKFWFEMIGTKGQSQAGRITPSQNRHSYGALAGMDIPMDNGGWLGVFGGYENGEVETNSQRASSEIDNYHIGAYTTQPVGNGFNISGGVGGTYHDVKTKRYVIFPGFQGAPEGETNGMTASGFVEVSKPIDTGVIGVEPFANLTLTHSRMDGYAEKNGNGSELAVKSTTRTNPTTTIGARVGKVLSYEDTTINLNAQLGWQHTFGDIDNGSTMRFVSGTTSFEAHGPDSARDSAIIGLGASAAVGAGTTAYAGYTGAISADSTDHGFRAGVKIEF